MDVAAIILTKNEEARIEDCLKHLRPYIDYILILDGESKDKTVEIAKKYADKIIVKAFSGSFAEERNYARTQVPKNCLWILWIDADERFDIALLRDIKKHLLFAEENYTVCWRFPRNNLPDGKDWPDYQTRLIKNSRDIEWIGDLHEIPYLITEGVPLDQLDKDGRTRKLSVITASKYPILHLARKTDEKRSWWE